MTIPIRTLRIGGALVIAISLVGGAYVITGPSFLGVKTVGAEGTEELLRAYAAKDSDGDLLPDWQEALYGTDPNRAVSTTHGVSDGEAVSKGLLTPKSLASELPQEDLGPTVTQADLPGVDPAPGSITDQFSKEFFKRYIAASNGSALSEEDQKALMDSLLIDFQSRASKILMSPYTKISVHTSVSVSILDYVGSVENILRVRDVPQGDGEPLPLMEAFLTDKSEIAHKKLEALGDSYRAIASDLAQLPVPPALSQDHLVLMQSFDSLARATSVVVNYEQDPLGVLGALALYQPSSSKIVLSFENIATIILSNGEPAPGTPGALLVQIARSAQKL
jgi:hypothetical protein